MIITIILLVDNYEVFLIVLLIVKPILTMSATMF